MATTTIQLDTRTREMLRRVGSKGQTYDEIIQELVELREAFIEDLRRILEETREDEWIPLEKVLRERGLTPP